MPIDATPIPPESLPPGWGPVDVEDGYVSYRHERLPIELVAERIVADHTHPSLGLGHCWALRYRRRVGEFVAAESIGQVSTRRAALEGLLACMHHVHGSITEISTADPIDLQSVLERVSLGDLIPPGTADRTR